MEPTIVTVHGEARREVPPEQAVFSVTVSVRDRGKPTVVNRLTERSAEVGRILDAFGPAIERRETTGLHVYEEYRRRADRSPVYAGSLTTTVTVTDFDPLGELLARLASSESVAVSGPWWQLRPGSRAGAEVRREAVLDALDRAREYAAAVGSDLDRIVEISDAETTGGVHPMAMRSAVAAAEADDGAAFDLDPHPQAVEARVLLRVTVTEPTVLRC